MVGATTKRAALDNADCHLADVTLARPSRQNDHPPSSGLLPGFQGFALKGMRGVLQTAREFERCIGWGGI